MPQTSIVIPVYNKWDLTSACLVSLAENTAHSSLEVIVVDNASSDTTLAECESLGRQLFGDAFFYLRNNENRNFSGACNQGARLAHGEFLVFLNNDTLLTPGWLPPLMDDFRVIPNLGATGPLLVYPKDEYWGYRVQHLGVAITPLHKVTHLYEKISADAPLARKRRFFQIITAACMLLPRQLFLDLGLFDEDFKNGFEDVDLCARIIANGLSLTVNPASMVIHLESQSEGRHDHEAHNSKILLQKCFKSFSQDWHKFLHDDGYDIGLSPWLQFEGTLPPVEKQKLALAATTFDQAQRKDNLIKQPFWREGWEQLINNTADIMEKHKLRKHVFHLWPNPDTLLLGLLDSVKIRDNMMFAEWYQQAGRFTQTPISYLKEARASQKFLDHSGLPDLAALYGQWTAAYPEFKEKEYKNFRQHFANFEKMVEQN